MRRSILVLLAVWIAAVAAWLRHDILDDAFIHLRYAEQLLAHHFLTYDGVTASQGTSSVLYVVALAALSAVFRWPYWPKVLALAGYVGLLTAVVRRHRDLGAWVVPIAALLASPMAVRTLTDGMETGWSTLVGVVVAANAVRSGEGRSRAGHLATIGLTGFVAVWLRIDMLAIVGAVLVATWLLGRGQAGMALALGAAAGVLALLATGFHVVPDAALAKNMGLATGRHFLTLIPIAHASAMFFGLGISALWAASWWRLHRNADKPLRRAALIVNVTGPLFWGATVLSGQITHGIRYFVPFYAFATTWNLLSAPPLAWPAWAFSTNVRRTGAVLLAVAFALELLVLRPVVSSRSATLLAFQAAGLERFRGQAAVALDVGQIGYFSGADICDVRGLVSGRAMALISARDRSEICWARRPVFAFMTDPQARAFPGLLSWPVCGQFALSNLRGPYLAQLRVRPDLGCAFTAHR